MRVRSAGRISLWLAGAAVLVLLLAQLVLPLLAASMISSRLGRYGHVNSVSVHAFPAIELLWGDADSITVKARNLTASATEMAKLVWEARGISRLDVSVERVRVGTLALSDASMRKRGAQLSAQADATQPAVAASLPAGISVRLLKSEAGVVEVTASGGLFGARAALDAVAQAREGKLIVHPEGLFLDGLTLTLFASPHLYVEGVGASRLSAAGGVPGYRLEMTARLR